MRASQTGKRLIETIHCHYCRERTSGIEILPGKSLWLCGFCYDEVQQKIGGSINFLPYVQQVLLHKLPRPDTLLSYLSVICREWLAVRLPAPILDDPRSRSMKLDITATLANRFERVQALRTYRGEWTAIFRRR